ncbi:VaFE repeat-containing surface-anchored protein [Microbacterium sp. NPDC091662]|uniref:VaFE repeat-containing surface-anchored protein n=1 Tax=Microbacterium sp. NPDC091662 TaxID=3364211 RepID=UPI0037F84D76
MRRRIAVALLALTLIAPASFASASAMAVESGDAVWIGSRTGHGYPGTAIFPIYSQTPADPSDPGEPDLWAYCIEHDVSALTNREGTVGDHSGYLGSNKFTDPAVQARVHWTITHSYPAVSLADLEAATGIAGLTRNDAIEATQYAIWNFTDLWSDPTTAWSWETPDSEAVYHYLVDGALAGAGATPPAPQAVSVSVAAPAVSPVAGSLAGPFVVTTDQPSARVSTTPAYAITDATGSAVDADAVVDGQELYIDLRGVTTAGSARLTAAVDGTGATGLVVSVPVVPGDTPTSASHAQSIVLVGAANAATSAAADITWRATASPTIGTTLTDAADGDQALPWNGGSLVDRIAYTGLTPGTEYTVSGLLMRKSDTSSTGITGSTTFTPTAADGSVDVTFIVPTGYAGQTLVAFEYLFLGATAAGTPIATHTDIDDAAQTVAVAAAPASGASASPADTSVGAARLAATGGDAPIGLISVAFLAVLSGAALLVIRRRVHV